MSFEALVDDVFRHGCGVSMQTALRSDEYERIRRQLQESESAYPEETALVELLGVKLAERAFRNMPWQVRKRIGEWHTGTDAQLRLLQYVCDQLDSRRWRRIGIRSYQYNSDNRCVLPAAMRSWQRGQVQPNCLGVAQMMVGFAQAVDAPHYLLNVVHSNQDTLHKYRLRALKALQGILCCAPDFAEYAKAVEQAYWNTLEVAGQPAQAHHVLVIQLDDGVWWVVDPYLRALYPLESQNWQAATEWVNSHHNRIALVRPVTPLDKYVAWINMHLQALRLACGVFEQRFGAEPKVHVSILRPLSYMVAHVPTRETAESDMEAFGRELAGLEYAVCDDSQDTVALEQMAVLALTYAVYDIETIPELNATINKSPERAVKRVVSYMEHAAGDRTLERELCLRLVRFALKHLMQYLEDLYEDPYAKQHECLEVSWAPMGIGIATLNHVQGTAMPGSPVTVDDSGRTAGLQGKLSSLFSGQWVLYDTLALAREKGEAIHPDYIPSIAYNLERHYEVPEMMITPLRLLSNG